MKTLDEDPVEILGQKIPKGTHVRIKVVDNGVGICTEGETIDSLFKGVDWPTLTVVGFIYRVISVNYDGHETEFLVLSMESKSDPFFFILRNHIIQVESFP